MFYGTYRGLMPTDESNLGMGEFTLEVSADECVLTHATGLENNVEHLQSNLREMTPDELNSDLDTSDPEATFSGFWIGEGQLRVVLISTDIQVGLLLGLGLVEEVFGPSPLFAPCDNLDEIFEQAVQDIENASDDPGAIPRIANDGVAPTDCA